MNQALLQRVQRECGRDREITPAPASPVNRLKPELDALTDHERDEVLHYLKTRTRLQLLDHLQSRATA